MPPQFVPIQGVSRTGIVAQELPHLAGNSYLSSGSDLYGTGHMGVGPLDRIIMSLNSGIESEIEYALGALTYYSCNEPKLLNFGVYPLMGIELIKYFYKPFQQMLDATVPRPAVVLLAVESLLSLRNAAQDLHNQQWLSQQALFRRHAGEVLRFLVAWFYAPQPDAAYRWGQYHELFQEALVHLLDLLDPLTCFYTDTPRTDPLFASLAQVVRHARDKHVLTTAIKCVHHMTFLGSATPKDDDAAASTAPAAAAANCIDAIDPDLLHVVVRALLVHDDHLTHTALQFLHQYVSSPALHPQYPALVDALQRHRMRKLARAALMRNCHILMKQLPQLVVANLPLVDGSRLAPHFPSALAARLPAGSVPAATVRLPQKLYDIIITFPEPLRATTWLRCCYEPYTGRAGAADADKDLAAGEVTQILLWKAYENQFEAIWKDRLNPKWPNLLPAVDFIKNVSSAFPNSEAMVVSIPTADPAQPARKKFIIKGIQPRQFPVNIDVGNFEALRRAVLGSSDAGPLGTYAGEVDSHAFRAAVEAFNDSLLSTSEGLLAVSDASAPWYSPLNALSRDILGRLVDQLLATDADGVYKSVFRQYNREWLPQCVYANPGLVEHGYIDARWLLYLL